MRYDPQRDGYTLSDGRFVPLPDMHLCALTPDKWIERMQAVTKMLAQEIQDAHDWDGPMELN